MEVNYNLPNENGGGSQPSTSGAVHYDYSQSLTEEQKATARENIGAVSESDIPEPQDAVLYTEQTLTSEQQAQARENIGAVSESDIPEPQAAVLYTEQELTSAQQAQARENIGALSEADLPEPQAAVLYTEQTLTSEQQAQARENIGAVSESDIPRPQAAVLYTAQTLTNAQKRQARLNIGAISEADIPEAENHQLLTANLQLDISCQGYVWTDVCRVEIPESGVYQISAMAIASVLSHQTRTDKIYAAIYKISGSTEAELVETIFDMANLSVAFSFAANLSQGDVISLKAYSDSSFSILKTLSIGKCISTFVAAVRIGAIYQAE